MGPLVRILARTEWTDMPAFVQDFSIDGPVLLFALADSAGTGILFGTLPAVAQSQARLTSRMSGAGRIAGGRSFLRDSLVFMEAGLAMTLLVGVGLLLSELRRIQRAELGFDSERLALVQLESPRNQYAQMGEVVGGRRIWTILPIVEAVGQRARGAACRPAGR